MNWPEHCERSGVRPSMVPSAATGLSLTFLSDQIPGLSCKPYALSDRRRDVDGPARRRRTRLSPNGQSNASTRSIEESRALMAETSFNNIRGVMVRLNLHD